MALTNRRPGPYGAGIFDPRAWAGGDEETTNAITLEFTRVVLAIGVFAIGVELPKAYMARHWKSIFMLLGPIMTYVRTLRLLPPCTLYPETVRRTSRNLVMPSGRGALHERCICTWCTG